MRLAEYTDQLDRVNRIGFVSQAGKYGIGRYQRQVSGEMRRMFALKIAVYLVDIGPAEIQTADGPDKELDAQDHTKVAVCFPGKVGFAFCHGFIDSPRIMQVSVPGDRELPVTFSILTINIKAGDSITAPNGWDFCLGYLHEKGQHPAALS
jgi:hypothetical protein